MPSVDDGGEPRVVTAAGAVVIGPKRRVLLVHRPKYDDWSFPKGKVDRGEHVLAAAVREVEEETGLRVRLGAPLAGQRYPVVAGIKAARYWLGRPIGDHDVRGYRHGEEIDAVRWVDPDEATSLLTYERDVRTLREARATRRKTTTVVVLRHGLARARRTWRGDDRRRPLLVEGRRQADRLVPLLASYDVRRLVSSSSTRCLQTLEPFATVSGRTIERVDDLSEEDATTDGVRRVVDRLVRDLHGKPAAQRAAVLCGHRPVLPMICAALGVVDPDLDKGEMLVVHLAKGRPVACERHRARPAASL